MPPVSTVADPAVVDARTLLFGHDPTPGIVSIAVGRDGRARVWRRISDTAVEDGAGANLDEGAGRSPRAGRSTVVLEEARFPSWFYLMDPDVLDPLQPERLDAGALLNGPPSLESGLAVVRLEGPGQYRYLVLTTRLPEVEARVLAKYRKQAGSAQARSLADLKGDVYARPLV